MPTEYIFLPPDAPLPIWAKEAFLAVIIAETAVRAPWRESVAHALAASGCCFFVAWGVDCRDWEDSMDWADIDAATLGNPMAECHIITTAHPDEPLSDALNFARYSAYHPDEVFERTVLIHIATAPRPTAFLQAYLDGEPIIDGDDVGFSAPMP